MNTKIQVCKNCIMDSTDESIVFDQDGICDYCHNFYNNILPYWKPNEEGEEKLMKLIDKIKSESKNKDYDCIIGISGGLDSSYAVYVAKEIMGLRPLVFHVDAGWNTQQAVENIEKLINGLDLEELHICDSKIYHISFMKNLITTI